MAPSRRALLRSVAVLGVSAPLAGCLDLSSDATASANATDTTAPTNTTDTSVIPDSPTASNDSATSEDGGTFSIAIEAVHVLTTVPSVVNVDEGEVTASEDRQFLFLTVRGASELVQSPSKFTVSVDGEQYRGLTTIGGASTTRPNPGFPDWFVAEGASPRTVAFRVPRTIETEDVVLHCCGGEDSVLEAVPSPAVDLLRSPPAFAVESLDVPETVAVGEDVVVSVTVSNGGGRAERLYGTVDTGQWYPLLVSTEEAVQPGGTATLEETVEFYPREGETTDVFTLDIGTERVRRTVTVESTDDSTVTRTY